MESDVKGKPPRCARYLFASNLPLRCRSRFRLQLLLGSRDRWLTGAAGSEAVPVLCAAAEPDFHPGLGTISSFGSVRGHSLIVGPSERARVQRHQGPFPCRSALGGTRSGDQSPFGCSPSNLATSEIVPSDRRAHEDREPSPASCARRSMDQCCGLYLSFFFHIASTAAASSRATVSRARLGRVPFFVSCT